MCACVTVLIGLRSESFRLDHDLRKKNNNLLAFTSLLLQIEFLVLTIR